MTMVERVARALCARHYADRFSKPVDDPHVQRNVAGNWALFADDACIAIEAMRDPTPAMLADPAVEDASFGAPIHGYLVDVPKLWAALITAALA